MVGRTIGVSRSPRCSTQLLFRLVDDEMAGLNVVIVGRFCKAAMRSRFLRPARICYARSSMD